MFIFMVFRFSETNMFETTSEKEHGRHVMFLQRLNKLFEVKQFANFAFFLLLYFLEVFATVYMFHNRYASPNRCFFDKKQKIYWNNSGKGARLVIKLQAEGLKL